MNFSNIHLLIIYLIALILISAFFSGSETAMLSINRYRLLHLMKKKHRAAQYIHRLLKRPDRLLGVILLCNTFANILASAIATMIAVHYFGQMGILIATIFLTLVLLLFSEITPKTLGAFYPEKLAFTAIIPLRLLLKIFYPVVWLLNTIANSLLHLCRLHIQVRSTEALTAEELKSLLNASSHKIPSANQAMLLRILDLQHMSVEDAMLPRNEIEGINLDDSWERSLQVIISTSHSYLPVYHEEIDNIKGILSIKEALGALSKGELTKDRVLEIIHDLYFIPEAAPLSQQLRYFQQQKKRLGLVVDEYGAIQGLLTLTDILEEVVGEFATDFTDITNLVKPHLEGGFEVKANISIRDFNRITGWSLPTRGAKTLSGLIIHYLESIPQGEVCLKIGEYNIEVTGFSKKRIQTVKINLRKQNSHDSL